MAEPLAFRVRWTAVDEQLLAAAKRRAHAGTLAEAEARENLGAVVLADIVQPEDGPSGHFGPKTRLFWWFVYRLFVGGVAVEHPPSFPAKAVLLADVYVPPVAWGGTAYLSVWAGGDSLDDGEPILVPFPRVPAVLMEPSDASFADSCRAYRELVGHVVDRVNLVAPAALTLAAHRR